jgi:predicted transcriptional regulator
MSELGKKIRQERRRNDITQTELAVAIGHKPNNVYISQVEKGVVTPTQEQYDKIMKAIDMIRLDKVIFQQF